MTETNLTKQPQTVASIMQNPSVMQKIAGCFGSESQAAGFISSVISVTNGNNYLRKCEPMSIVGAAMVAATLQLPVVPTMGYAYIIPYGRTSQFQLGYKGLLQLCLRSGEIRNIISEPVHKGELVRRNKFTGDYEFDEGKRETDEIIGYMARLELVNGFNKTIYWTKDEVVKHAKKYSQAFRAGRTSPWTDPDQFDRMCEKTVLKALLSKYAPQSIEMATALKYDQARIKVNSDNVEDLDIDMFTPEYIDNEPQLTEATVEEVDPSKDLFGDKEKKQVGRKKESDK